ncbi:MAG: serine/threonine-protein kinase [Anaerolineae bacterium]|jgi:serine/threonine protein kinase
MRDLIRQILKGYKSLKLEGQDQGYVLFTGQDPSTRQQVSIKIVPRLLGEDPKIADRFTDLARAIRQLNHPNIASIRKVGEESGLPYVITRALEKGHSLAADLDQPWAVDTAADVVTQVGQALEHAYKKGVVHGDLNPDNIVVEDDGRIQVTDFGMTELIELVGGETKKAASPYVAPERAAGGGVDSRADVYSLAAILYSMLAKRQPQVVKGEVLPPSRFNPDVSPAMDKVVVRALAPDPAARYPDVKTFLAALASTTLVRAADQPQASAPDGSCPHCGAAKQQGRFCRKCGLRLEQQAPAGPSAPSLEESVLDEPIQVTKVEVTGFGIGAGVELTETNIAQPLPVTSRELAGEFPEPLEMPKMDLQTLWPSQGDKPMITMPEPPPMPAIDWAEIAPPMPEVPVIEDVPDDRESD